MDTSPLSFPPSGTYEEALDRAADLWGIERQYWDIFGTQHFATAEGIAAVLSSLGVPSSTREDLDEACQERLVRQWTRATPPSLVIGETTKTIPIRLPAAHADGAVTLTVEFEGGDKESWGIGLRELPATVSASFRGSQYVEKQIPLPFQLRLGYHSLAIEGEGIRPVFSDLIIGPDRAYYPEMLAGNGRAAGIAVSLYGVRSANNWGCGDFTDLKALSKWVGDDLGASFVALNPLHAIPNRTPYNTSPYLPACAFYKNFIYLDLTAIPDYSRSPLAQKIVESPKVRANIKALREAKYVDYHGVARLKLRMLKVLFRTFLTRYLAGSADTNAFREYVSSQGDLLDCWAVYCALDEHLHKENSDIWLWTDWPEPYQNPRTAETREFSRSHWRSVLFYKYIQWQIDVQLGAAQQYAKDCGLAIGLYHDLALATDRFGADLWAHRRFYVEGCRVGAPPDDFSPSGQDWSFPPPNADAHFEDGYRLFAESIRKNLRHGGALRIDHVMRFFHLFWIPGALGDAKRGIYVKDRSEDLIRILALESVRNKVIVIGEDLGTVADEVRETLHRFGILSYRLFYFEKTNDGRMRLPHEYPRQALVSASTHDLPTLAGFWKGRDIEARLEAGIFGDGEDHRKRLAARETEKQRMLDVLFTLGLMPKNCSRSAADYPDLTGDIHNAIVGFLATAPSTLMVLNEEDLMKQLDQQNLPGTTAEYPNWSHKTRFTVEELKQVPARDFALMYRGWLNVTARLNR